MAARAALAISHEAAEQGRLDEALASAEIVTALFPDTIDGYAQQVRVALAADRAKHGLEAGRAALQLMPGSSELLLATAGFAHACGEPDEAIGYCSRLLGAADVSAFERGSGHGIIGTALDDVGQVYAARAHLTIARGLLPNYVQLCLWRGFTP